MIKNLFKLDLRSLALARVFLGLLAIYDIGRRLDDLGAFYSDSGILTRSDLLTNFELPWRMTLLSLNGSYYFALGISILGLIAAVMFTIGWKTRTSTAVVWLVITSFQARFPEVATSGGDMLLRIFFLWAFFLPMNALYSVDHAVSEKKYDTYEYFSVFSTIWIIQVFILYFFTFLYKWAPVYHTSFEAVWFMLQLDTFTTPLGKWLGNHLGVTKVLSFFSYALELIGPLLLLIPWKRDLFRGAAVFAFWCFHLGIGLTLHLGNFVPICLIIWVGLIPTSWWHFLGEKVKATSEKAAALFYDAETPYSRELCLIGKELLMLEVEVLPSSKGNFVLKNQTGEVTENLQLFSKLLLTSKIFPVRYFGKALGSDLSVYLSEVKEAGSVKPSAQTAQGEESKLSLIARTLFETVGFGKVKLQLNKLERFIGSFLLTLIVMWNIEGYIQKRDWYIGSPFDEIMFSLHLQQGWAMFAPHPQRSDGWWVMDGNLRSGKKWDALHNKEVNFDKPEDVYATFSSDDWRKFLDNVQGSRDDRYLLALGRFLCRDWNAKHSGGEVLENFKLHFVQEWTNGPNEAPSNPENMTVWNHSCF